MLLEPSDASDFLKRYKKMICEESERPPNSFDEWIDFRDRALESLAKKSAVEARRAAGGLRVDDSISGRFCFLKRYKDHCAFFHMDQTRYFAVRSLTTPMEEMLPQYCVIETTLVPYQDLIVCDGLIRSANVLLGTGFSKEIRDGYWIARRQGSLVWSIPEASKGPSSGKEWPTSEPSPAL